MTAHRPASMNHVFVDFENVPSVDLELIRDRPAQVTLLIGEKQRRLELNLVRQIHAYAAQVTLIEVGASGRNALDMVLAWHLGHLAALSPDAMFFVVSKDKDFDPLIKHLRARGLEIARVDAFASLPFLGVSPAERRRSAPSRRSRAAAAPSAPAPVDPELPLEIHEPAQDPRVTKLIDRLQHKTKARPVRRKTLLSYINGFFQNALSTPELDAVASTLAEKGVISLSADGRVSYPHD